MQIIRQSGRNLRTQIGMTLMEILLVVSLVSMISLALYKSLANGIKVYQRSQRMIVEEDIAVFLDRLTGDLRNTFLFSQIAFEGSELKLSFPTIVRVPADPSSDYPPGEYIDQIGRVEYSFELYDDKLFYKVSDYGQGIDQNFNEPRVLLQNIKNIRFGYISITPEGEVVNPSAYGTLPATVQVEIEFSDEWGKKSIVREIDIPAGSS